MRRRGGEGRVRATKLVFFYLEYCILPVKTHPPNKPPLFFEQRQISFFFNLKSAPRGLF